MNAKWYDFPLAIQPLAGMAGYAHMARGGALVLRIGT